ncbi:MAG: M13-type metalloendopeptidase [Vulcanimicrobiota bacterium]
MIRNKTLMGCLLLSGLALATPENQHLKWKKLDFAVQAHGPTCTLQPRGLSATNAAIQQQFEGSLRPAQIADLDGDGWPEILLTWQMDDSHQGAAVYSVNNGKSLSQVSFAPDSELGTFAFKGQQLIHTDLNTIETHYRLKNGEASKKLVADKFKPSMLDFGLPRGFSTQKMLPKVDPKSDFANYSSGVWLKRSHLTPELLQISAITVVSKSVGSQVQTVLEDARKRSPQATKGTPLQQVGDFYASGMDAKRLQELGASPIKAELEKLSEVDSPAKFALACCHWSELLNEPIYDSLLVSPDLSDRSHYTLYLTDGLLGMSTENYTQPAFAKLRSAYVEKIQSILELYGIPSQEAQAQAKAYLETETRLAGKKLTPAQRRDPNNAFRKMSWEQAVAAYPALDLPGQVTALKLGKPAEVWVLGPDGVAERNAIVAEGNWKLLRDHLRVAVLLKASPYFGPDFDAIGYKYTKVLYGDVKDTPRPQKLASVTANTLGHPLSQLYVARYFPAERRKSVEGMLNRIRREFRRRIERNQWLQPETRKQALEKFDAIEISVGYPDEWIDYSSVDVRRDDFLGNVFRINRYLFARSMGRMGKPVKVDRFSAPGQTLPIDVNAAYSSDSNKVEIAAAILQPPFYDPNQDMAVNLGTLGAVIGHELTHGFDSSGRLYDAKGNVRDWWTAADAKHFEQENQKLIDQANQFKILPGLGLNGPLESGENLADAGGLSLGFSALQTYLKEHPEERKPRQGLTPEQRYFLAWAQLWSEKSRDQIIRQLNLTDSHPPGSYRQSQAARHEAGFFKTFGIKPGDPLWMDESKRINVW